MTRRPRLKDRPMPVFRQCDGVPWPSDHELELGAEWAARRESGDVEWWAGDQPASAHSVSSSAPQGVSRREPEATDACDDAGAWQGDDVMDPLDGDVAAISDIDARLGHLERVISDRQRATADEYRLILTILDDAAFDPTPWVGPDPTLDRAWNDARGRTAGAVRRDRVDLAERAAVAEIAVRLRLSEQTVRTRAAHARTLVNGCPRMWAAFSEGRLSEKHVVDAARLASTLPAGDTEAFQRFDDAACPLALALTPAKFAVAARAVRERVHAESIDARHRRAAEDRGVWMRAELDGMASLHALMPADRARAVMSRLDGTARHLRAAPDEERTLAQLRADALADLVTLVESSTATIPSSVPDTADPAPRAAVAARHTPGAADAVTHTPGATHTPVATHDAIPTPGATHDAIPTPGATHDAIPTPGATHDAIPTPGATHDAMPTPGATDDARRTLRALQAASPGSSAPDAVRTFRAAPPATVVVTVPAFTLLGRDTAPATLEGYGPIDLDTARRLAGQATSWVRLLTHPVTGAPLVLDRTTYRVPAALRRWLGVTSPTCVFPGCGRAARECDIDHLTAWADGGTTDDANLDPKCRHHHRLRHESRWDIDHPPGEDGVWTSPLGGRYGTDPPPF